MESEGVKKKKEKKAKFPFRVISCDMWLRRRRNVKLQGASFVRSFHIYMKSLGDFAWVRLSVWVRFCLKNFFFPPTWEGG
jgi:hypothetical protein